MRRQLTVYIVVQIRNLLLRTRTRKWCPTLVLGPQPRNCFDHHGRKLESVVVAEMQMDRRVELVVGPASFARNLEDTSMPWDSCGTLDSWRTSQRETWARLVAACLVVVMKRLGACPVVAETSSERPPPLGRCVLHILHMVYHMFGMARHGLLPYPLYGKEILLSNHMGCHIICLSPI